MTRGEARALFLVMLLLLAAGGAWLVGPVSLLVLGALLLVFLSFVDVQPAQPPQPPTDRG